MTQNDNPFAPGGQSGYSGQSVSFGTQASGMNAPAARPTAPAANGPAVFDVTTQSFRAEVLEASKSAVILVDFWAPWCGPCKQLTPVLEKVVKEAGGAVRLAKMNIDEHPSIAGQLGVQSIPAVVAFRNGQPVDAFMGAVPESEIRAFIKKNAGPAKDPKIELLEAADQAREAGDLESAAQILSMGLQRGIMEPELFAGLVDILFDLGDEASAMSVLEQVPEEMRGHAAFSRIDARLKLSEEVAKLGDPASLIARIANDPNDHEAKFDLSAIHNAKGERMEAADLLLSIMKADRAWNEDGARKRLLEYFEAWGFKDPATQAARRKLSSMFFS